MRFPLAAILLALTLPTTFAQSKDPAPALPKPVPAKDAAAVKFEKFELKDAKLLSVIRVIRAKAYNQGELIDMLLIDPKDELAGRVVTMSLTDTTVGQVMQILSRAADFKYAIKGNTITIEPK